MVVALLFKQFHTVFQLGDGLSYYTYVTVTGSCKRGICLSLNFDLETNNRHFYV